MTSEKGVGNEWEFAGYLEGTSIPVYAREIQKDTVLVSSGEIQDAFDQLEENLHRKKDQDAGAGLAFYNDGGSACDSNAAVAFMDTGFVMTKSAMSLLADRAAAAGVSKENYLKQLYRKDTANILYKHMHEEPLKGFGSPD